jgi:hypothetical protein
LGLACVAFFIGVGDVFRPQGILIIGAILMAEFVQCWIQGMKLKRGLVAVSLLVMYLAFTTTVSTAVRLSGINDQGLKNTFPEYKVVVGLNPETRGMYSMEDSNLLLSIQNKDLRRKTALSLIQTRLADPRQVLILLAQKQKIMWWDEDASLYWGFGYLSKNPFRIMGHTVSYGEFRNHMVRIEKAFYLWVMILVWLTVSLQFRKKSIEHGVLFSLMMVLLSLAIYAVIEIQPRYRDLTVIVFFMLSAEGCAWVLQKIQEYGLSVRGFNKGVRTPIVED